MRTSKKWLVTVTIVIVFLLTPQVTITYNRNVTEPGFIGILITLLSTVIYIGSPIAIYRIWKHK